MTGPVPKDDRACTCANDGNAYKCPVHTQDDFEAADKAIGRSGLDPALVERVARVIHDVSGCPEWPCDLGQTFHTEATAVLSDPDLLRAIAVAVVGEPVETVEWGVPCSDDCRQCVEENDPPQYSGKEVAVRMAAKADRKHVVSRIRTSWPETVTEWEASDE